MRISEKRPLSDQERSLLDWLLRHGTPEAGDYASQLPQVTVVSRCGCGCPTIDLAVAGRSAPPGSPTTILADGEGISPEGVRCGIILFARDGILSEMEFYPVDGDVYRFSLPLIDSIKIY
jgi:hypothetical protein